MTARRRLDLRDEMGAMGGLEALPFGVLIFVVGILMVGNAWGVVDAKIAASAAAREAARAFVEAPDADEARSRAQSAASATLRAHGRDPDRMDLDDGGSVFARCARVTVAVRYPVPAVVLPWGRGLGEGFVAVGRHTEIVDPLRSGIEGTAGGRDGSLCQPDA